jgi:hypothetical protein
MDLVGKPHHEQEAATEAWNLASDEGGGGASLFCNREELGAWKRGMNCECGNGEEGQGGGVPFIGPIEGAKAVAVGWPTMVLQCTDSFGRWGVGWAPFSGVNGEGRRCGSHF